MSIGGGTTGGQELHDCSLFFFRIHKYASCSNECYILALIYIDRLIQRNNFLLTELNVHRAVITAVLLAAKFFDDAYYNNAYYAKIGGVLVSEMNGLEVDFLFRINFSLHVTPAVFEKYRAELWSHSTNTSILPSEPQFNNVSPVPTPQLHHHASAPVCTPPLPMMTTGPVSAPTSISHTATGAMRVASEITPSPPAEAGRTVDDTMMVQQQQQVAKQFPDFLPMQRANTMPVQVKGPEYYHHRSNSTTAVQRCSQNSTLGATMQYPNAVDEQFMVVDSQYPAGFHHQTGASDNGAYGDARLGHMLTGVSGL